MDLPESFHDVVDGDGSVSGRVVYRESEALLSFDGRSRRRVNELLLVAYLEMLIFPKAMLCFGGRTREVVGSFWGGISTWWSFKRGTAF